MAEAKIRILFVEDDPIVLKMYRRRLERENFQIETAENGKVAIEILPQVLPDLVVLDLMLPKSNGLEVLKFIRADARLKATPVMILSNVYMGEMAQKAMQAGANKGMLKTECTPGKLVEAVQDLLGCPPLPVNNNPFVSTGVKSAAKSYSAENSQAKTFLATAAAAHAEEASTRDARNEFLEDAPAVVAGIRDYFLAYLKAAGSPAGSQSLNNLYQQVHSFSTRAGLNCCTKIALLGSAFEALLFEVVTKPSYATPSVQQTITQAVDCLARLLQNGETGTTEPKPRAKVLVVDDDPVCNYMTVGALKRAHLDPVSVEDPNVALQLLQSNHIDLVLLDISMPTMSGFELCEKLRSLPQHKNTPVIFVTVNGDFQKRAQSVLSGGNDLITKPTSSLELALKTAMHLLAPQGLRVGMAVQSTKIQTDTLKLATVLPDNQSADATTSAPPAEEPIATEPANDAPTGETIEPGNLPQGIESMPTESLNHDKTATDTEFRAIETDTDELPDDLKQLLSEIEATETGGRKQDTIPDSPEQSRNELSALSTPDIAETPLLATSTSLVETEDPGDAVPANEISPEKLAGIEITNQETSPNNKELNMIMENKHNEPLDKIAQAVAQIMFGDKNVTELNARLTRIALERFDIQPTESLDKIAQAVTRIMFGDNNVTELNVRLTRIALERYNIQETTNSRLTNTDSTGNSAPRTAPEPAMAGA